MPEAAPCSPVAAGITVNSCSCIRFRSVVSMIDDGYILKHGGTVVSNLIGAI